MHNQRERWAIRNYSTLRKRFGETVTFTPVTGHERTGYQRDQAREIVTIGCLVQREETGTTDLDFGRSNSPMNVATGEVGLQMLASEFANRNLRKGDYVELSDGSGPKKYIVDRCDNRHPPFVYVYLANWGTDQ